MGVEVAVGAGAWVGVPVGFGVWVGDDVAVGAGVWVGVAVGWGVGGDVALGLALTWEVVVAAGAVDGGADDGSTGVAEHAARLTNTSEMNQYLRGFFIRDARCFLFDGQNLR